MSRAALIRCGGVSPFPKDQIPILVLRRVPPRSDEVAVDSREEDKCERGCGGFILGVKGSACLIRWFVGKMTRKSRASLRRVKEGEGF